MTGDHPSGPAAETGYAGYMRTNELLSLQRTPAQCGNRPGRPLIPAPIAHSEVRTVRDLAAWLARGASPSAFPYRAVLASYHTAGKHRVASEILVALDEIRHRLPGLPPTPARQRLDHFLDSALDKFDGRYDYRSYLALPLLALPGRHDRPDNDAADRLTVQLIADALAFELGTAAGQDRRLPLMRPSQELALGPAVRRRRYRR